MGTRGEWAADFLHALGNGAPSDDAIKMVAAWTAAENTDAAYNPLATTLKLEPSSDFNYAGVKNYESRQQGIDASVRTLQGNFFGYARLREGLQQNDVNAALYSGGLDTWGSKTSHVATIYLARDVRQEQLKSEAGRQASGRGGPQPPQAAPPGVGGGPRPNPGGASNGRLLDDHSIPGQIDADQIRQFAKILLGAAFVGFGLFIIVVNLIIQSKPAQVLVPAVGKAARIAGK